MESESARSETSTGENTHSVGKKKSSNLFDEAKGWLFTGAASLAVSAFLHITGREILVMQYPLAAVFILGIAFIGFRKWAASNHALKNLHYLAYSALLVPLLTLLIVIAVEAYWIRDALLGDSHYSYFYKDDIIPVSIGLAIEATIHELGEGILAILFGFFCLVMANARYKSAVKQELLDLHSTKV